MKGIIASNKFCERKVARQEARETVFNRQKILNPKLLCRSGSPKTLNLRNPKWFRVSVCTQQPRLKPSTAFTR